MGRFEFLQNLDQVEVKIKEWIWEILGDVRIKRTAIFKRLKAVMIGGK